MCELFNSHVIDGPGLHEEPGPKGRDESLELIVQFLYLKLNLT